MLERPVRWRVGHDEGDFVGGVGCFGLAFFVEHFFGVAGVRGFWLVESRKGNKGGGWMVDWFVGKKINK